MKSKSLLILLMTLPLVACSGNKGDKPNPGPGPDVEPKEVKRSELLAAFNEIGAAVTGEASFAFDEEQDTYVNEGNEHYYATDIYEGTKSEGMTWETALNDFTKELPSKYIRVFAPREFTWEDGDKGIETAYTLGDTIYVSMATWEDSEDTSIYVSYAVMPNEGVTFVDDGDPIINDGPKETVKTFTFKDAKNYNSEGKLSGFDLTQESNRQPFVNWFNGSDDLLESVELSENNYAQFNEVTGNKNEADKMYNFVLSSRSKDCDLKFNFKYTITKVTLKVQAFCKYIAYNDSWSIDTESTIAINSRTDVVDLSTTNTAAETPVITIERTFDKTADINSLQLFTNSGGRVFLNEISITYVK